MRLLTRRREAALVTLAIVAWFGALPFLLDAAVVAICAAVGIGGAGISLLPVVLASPGRRRIVARLALLGLLAVLLVPVAYLAPRLDWGILSVFAVVLLVALAIVFFYYALLVPMALVERFRSDREVTREAPSETVSVIVPAYNEEDCIGASVEALKRSDYPDRATEIVVVDDGSTDDTYREALARADERVTVLSKPNGGKHSALNHGLDHASGEIVVTIDADSLLERDGLRRIAAAFRADEDLGAVAGDIGVVNRGSPIAELQELEYVVGIQLFRRAFSLAGTVIVVPGAFGAFRRHVLEEVGRFDGDTLTEDRDATVKILKAGYGAAAIDARCLTEAPETWKDLYRQRLRWYRGTVQTIRKHRDVFRRPDLGFLYSFAFPLEVFTVVGVPLAGVVIVGAIVLELLFGSVLLVVALFLFFAGLQALVSLLAVTVGDRDPRIVLYAPLFVLGYRQFLDAVMIKSTIDVLSNRELSWTSAARTGRLRDLASRGRDPP